MSPSSFASDVAFTPAVKAIQEQKGSRKAYARMERGEGWATEISEDLASFIARQNSFFLATASSTGQPYIQHRGGPPGFLEVLDAKTLAFGDLGGNRQYISLGNLAENPRVHLFLMDFARRQRVKIWGTAEVLEKDLALLAAATISGAGRLERVIRIRVEAWDVNCPQHIPQKIDAAEVEEAVAVRDRRIAALEAELRALRGVS